jgi:anti-sigma B factor antagonist
MPSALDQGPVRPAQAHQAAGIPAAFEPQEVTQMPEVSFPVEMVDGVPVVATPEEIDVTNAAGLRAALLQAAAPGTRTLVVDMSRTQFCDSAGLNVLVRAHKQAQADSGQLLLVVGAAAVLRIFVATGIGRLIPSFPSLAQALAHTTAVPDSPSLPAAAAPPTDPQPLGATG